MSESLLPALWIRPTPYPANEPAFLGSGWGFPPCFSPADATILMTSGEANIRESLWILLSTTCGERLMLASYGCQIWSKIFDCFTNTLANEISVMVQNAIIEWEPRIDVEKVEVTEMNSRKGQLVIDISYRIRQTNSRSNFVYPFYLQEATLPPPTP